MRIKASDWVLHPPGRFHGKITAIEERVSQFDTLLVVTVETTSPDGKEPVRSLSYEFPYMSGVKSRLGKLHRAVTGKETDTDGEINTEELIGGRATLTVEHIVKDNRRRGHRISKWEPLQKTES